LTSHVNANKTIIAAILTTAIIGAAAGAQTADAIQAAHYDNPEWINLDAAFVVFSGTLGALAGLELGRWITDIRAGVRSLPVGREWLAFVYRTLLRISAAAIGLRLGAEAGFWIAMMWDTYGSTANTNAYLGFPNVWIGSGCIAGAVFAVLGYWKGLSPPTAAALLGSYLGLLAVPVVKPTVADLYWGPYPSSDFHALVQMWAGFLTTSSLVLAFAASGYWSARAIQQWIKQFPVNIKSGSGRSHEP
jgi:hypothetical protein